MDSYPFNSRSRLNSTVDPVDEKELGLTKRMSRDMLGSIELYSTIWCDTKRANDSSAGELEIDLDL